MRGIGGAFAIACALARVAAAAPPASPPAPASATSPSLVAVYWEPPGAPPIAGTVRAAFVEALRPLAPRVLDVHARPPAAPPLAPLLDGARGDYNRFAFGDAIRRLDELARLVDARGGADLDARQLSEVFFYRGLCRLELGAADAAWEDLVRAARLDPSRVVDTARFPPRAVAAYRRAVAEVAQLPRVELTVDAPAGAAIRVDGAPAARVAAVPLGAHFVAVTVEGYAPWAGVVSASGARTTVAPPLVAYRPPDGDELQALAGPSAREVVLGALEPTPSGWRFVARDVVLAEGKVVSDAVVLGDAPAAALVRALVRRVVPEAAPRRGRWRWWVVGGAAAAVVGALAIGLGIGYGVTQTPTVQATWQ